MFEATDDTPDEAPEATEADPEGDAADETEEDAQGVAEADSDAPEDEADETDAKPKLKFREKLALAEQERDELRDQLARQHRALAEDVFKDGNVPPKLLADINLDDFVQPDGTLDTAALAEQVETVRLELGLPEKSRRPAPNPIVGKAGGPSPHAEGLGEALKKVAGAGQQWGTSAPRKAFGE
ncbi:MAG: hypothetical protein WBA50_10745 [Mycobacterium sp.]